MSAPVTRRLPTPAPTEASSAPTRRPPVALLTGTAIALVALLVLARPNPSLGSPCTSEDLASDESQLLACENSTWTEVATVEDFEHFDQVANPRLVELAEQQIDRAVRAAPMAGVGAWVDVYDWSPTFVLSKRTDARPGFTLDRIDELAELGVSTLYIQTAAADISDPVLDRHLLESIITRAHDAGMSVVGWYLPTFRDLLVDIAHLEATATLDIDAIGLDIEDIEVAPDVRTYRLLEMSRWLRETYPDLGLAAIVVPPVQTDIVNPQFWPGFPWAELDELYDVWMPMGYWTDRTPESGWRHGYRSTVENIARIRSNLNRPDALVHPIGGVSNLSTDGDIEGYVRAARRGNVIGASLYDDLTSTDHQYELLAPMRG